MQIPMADSRAPVPAAAPDTTDASVALDLQPPVIVIGAGPAGLAASACLRRRGVPHLVLEREREAAQAWRRHYDRLHLHTVKRHSALPGMPWPKSAPTYPSRQAVVDYFDAYVNANDIRPRLGVTVERITRQGERFEVRTDAGTVRPKAVVVATGYNRVPFVPFVPDVPGRASFAGPQLHASAYRNPAPFQGLRTLVVGCGNSGAEIALDLAEQGVDTTMVVRGPVHVAPRDMFGRPSQVTNLMLSYLPLALRDRIATTALRLVVGDLSRWGIERPAMGPNAMIEQYGRIPLLDIGTIAMVRQGRIRVRPGVQAIEAEQVTFADGRREPFDAIVFATGYRNGLEDLVEGFASIADARGRPHRFGEETAIEGLYFVGFRNPPTGALREIAIEAPKVAAAIAATLSR